MKWFYVFCLHNLVDIWLQGQELSKINNSNRTVHTCFKEEEFLRTKRELDLHELAANEVCGLNTLSCFNIKHLQ